VKPRLKGFSMAGQVLIFRNHCIHMLSCGKDRFVTSAQAKRPELAFGPEVRETEAGPTPAFYSCTTILFLVRKTSSWPRSWANSSL
jgi:hypothetical protein